MNTKHKGLMQTPLSRETGPGNPSGHVMINVVTGLALVDLVVHSGWFQGYMHLVVKRVMWNLFFGMIISMSISRVFLLAHFPHQCTLALLCGYLSFNRNVNWQRWSREKRITTALVLLYSALLVYSGGKY